MPKRTKKDTTYPDVSPRTREILNIERWFKNGPPQWRVGKAQRPAQTSKEAEKQRCKTVKQLRAHADDFPEVETVAERLSNCDADDRCFSGACPECTRAYVRWLVASGAKLLSKDPGAVSTLSLVHHEMSAPLGDLTPKHIQRARRKLQSILTKVGITTCMGGIDLSANESEIGDLEPYFQIQLWGLTPTDQVDAAKRKLKAVFPRTPTTPRPVKIQEWDGDLAALGYALKNTFDRRVSYICEDKFGRRSSHQNTRDRALKAEQQVELLIVLDQVGLDGRLQLSGCRVVKTQSGPEIRLIRGEWGKGVKCDQ